jgi:APA family basic amino acid/polyamine antiporter
MATVINVGVVCGVASVVLILLLGQTRVFFAMSRDGLLPKMFSEIHPKYGTPHRSTMTVAVIVAAIAGLTPISEIDKMVNIGTLFAFVIVSASVIILRRTRPELPRPFRVPLVPLLPILAILASLWLMLNLPAETWIRFAVWMAIGFVIYFAYSARNSRLAEDSPQHRVDV